MRKQRLFGKSEWLQLIIKISSGSQPSEEIKIQNQSLSFSDSKALKHVISIYDLPLIAWRPQKVVGKTTRRHPASHTHLQNNNLRPQVSLPAALYLFLGTPKWWRQINAHRTAFSRALFDADKDLSERRSLLSEYQNVSGVLSSVQSEAKVSHSLLPSFSNLPYMHLRLESWATNATLTAGNPCK